MEQLDAKGYVFVDIKPLNPQLTEKRKLGEGAYGSVFRIELKDVPKQLCLKVMKTSCSLRHALHEANALAVMEGIKGVPQLVAVSLKPPGIIMTMHGTETLFSIC